MTPLSVGKVLSLYQVPANTYQFQENDVLPLIGIEAYMRVSNDISDAAEFIQEEGRTYSGWDGDNGFGIFGKFEDVKVAFAQVLQFLQGSLDQPDYENDLNSYSYVDNICLYQIKDSDLGVVIGFGYYEAAIAQQNAFIEKLMQDARFIVVEAGAEHNDHSPVEELLELIEYENLQSSLALEFKAIFPDDDDEEDEDEE